MEDRDDPAAVGFFNGGVIEGTVDDAAAILSRAFALPTAGLVGCGESISSSPSPSLSSSMGELKSSSDLLAVLESRPP
jgi:hypothetical protein